MNRNFLIVQVLNAMFFAMVSAAQAADSVSGGTKPQADPHAAVSQTQTASKPLTDVEGSRDPFAVSDELQAYAQPTSLFSRGPQFKVGIQPQALPKMRMRGYLKGKKGEPVAMLEVADGVVHIIREGDTVGLQEIGQDAVIQIKTIDRLHLVIEAGTLGKVIIVR